MPVLITAPTIDWIVTIPIPSPTPELDCIEGYSPTLTERELEVVHLLAARWTDQEIADALCISYRTVTTHVSHILAKLGLPSRRAVSAYLRDQVGPGR